MSLNALIVQDIQNDFMPGGGYPVPHGDEIIALINKLIDYARNNGWLLIFTRDWHPVGMNHCIQNTKGAMFHPDLKIKSDDVVISKGQDKSDKHYSAFNGDDISLLELLNNNRIINNYIAGLALDYCVLNTALDSVKNGFKTYVITDACRAVNKNGISEKQALDQMLKSQIKLIQSDKLIKKSKY